jgi:hypothetical protein
MRHNLRRGYITGDHILEELVVMGFVQEVFSKKKMEELEATEKMLDRADFRLPSASDTKHPLITKEMAVGWSQRDPSKSKKTEKLRMKQCIKGAIRMVISKIDKEPMETALEQELSWIERVNTYVDPNDLTQKKTNLSQRLKSVIQQIWACPKVDNIEDKNDLDPVELLTSMVSDRPEYEWALQAFTSMSELELNILAGGGHVAKTESEAYSEALNAKEMTKKERRANRISLRAYANLSRKSREALGEKGMQGKHYGPEENEKKDREIKEPSLFSLETPTSDLDKEIKRSQKYYSTKLDIKG